MKPFISMTLLALLALGGTAAGQNSMPSVPLGTPPPAPVPVRTPASTAPAVAPVMLPQTPPVAVPSAAQPAAAQPALPAVPAPADATPAPTPTPRRATATRKTKAAAPTPTPTRTARVKSQKGTSRRAGASQDKGQAQSSKEAVSGAGNPAVPAVPLGGGAALPIASNVPPVSTPKAGAQPPDVNVQIGVKLERIRVQRAKTFATIKAEPDKELADDETLWSSELALQMRLTPARDWDVLEVTQAGIQQALDQNGQLIPSLRTIGSLSPTSPAPELNPFEPAFRKAGNGAMVILHTVPPAATVRAFKELSTSIRTTLGYRRPLKISDVRSQVGTSLMRNSGLDDVALQITDAEHDNIDLIGIGKIGRIGDIEFEDAATGKKLSPYNVETGLKELPPAAPNTEGKQGKEWRYSFTKLPARVNMTVTLYPVLMPRNLTVTFRDVPMP